MLGTHAFVITSVLKTFALSRPVKAHIDLKKQKNEHNTGLDNAFETLKKC